MAIFISSPSVLLDSIGVVSMMSKYVRIEAALWLQQNSCQLYKVPQS